MLPEPTLTFTIPSVHDGLHLDCRIYHPASLRASPNAPAWRRHGAVLAHPYAPLGGSYDDPLVDIVGEKMLREGYLLATFNFRGAGNSAGKTSWTAKAERYDFQSVIAFVAYYIHHIDPFKNIEAPAAGDTDNAPKEPNGAAKTEVCNEGTQAPLLVIAGYSYGSLITAQLPPLDTILEPFASPDSDSNEAQIRLRATSLAEQQNKLIGFTRKALVELNAGRSASSRGVRVGGDESGHNSPRRSTDSGHHRRSISRELEEKLHEIVAKTRSSLGSQRHNRSVSNGTLRKVAEEEADDDDDNNNNNNGATKIDKQAHTKEPAEGRLPPLPSFTIPRPAYVLLSPIPGLASHLVTMRVLPNALSRAHRPEEDPAEAKLVRNPTLAVHGDADKFVMPYKAREWVARLGGAQDSRFQGVEVPTAGHFWVEEGVMEKMLDLVGEFMDSLLGGGGSSGGGEDK